MTQKKVATKGKKKASPKGKRNKGPKSEYQKNLLLIGTLTNNTTGRSDEGTLENVDLIIDLRAGQKRVEVYRSTYNEVTIFRQRCKRGKFTLVISTHENKEIFPPAEEIIQLKIITSEGSLQFRITEH